MAKLLDANDLMACLMKKSVQLVLLTTLISAPLLSFAANCNREDIIFYLKQGFSHDQVTKICYTPQGKPLQVDHTGKTQQSGTSTTANRPQQSSDTMIFFKSSIDSDELEITRSEMVLTKHHQCIKYGIEDGAGFRDKACVQLQTTIQLPGLKVLKAKKAIPLIGKPELVIEGNIKHQIMNLSVLSAKQRKELLEDFDLNPARFELDLRGGVNPKIVENKLVALIIH